MPKTNVDLYRAIINGSMDGPFVIKGKPKQGLLYPRLEETTYLDASGMEHTSPADVDIVDGEVQAGGGTSMFDVKGWFGHAHWRYFQVPSETEYPDGLFIKRGKSKRKNKRGDLVGRHYQLEPKCPMTVDAFKGALDTFARNAVAKFVENAK